MVFLHQGLRNGKSMVTFYIDICTLLAQRGVASSGSDSFNEGVLSARKKMEVFIVSGYTEHKNSHEPTENGMVDQKVNQDTVD